MGWLQIAFVCWGLFAITALIALAFMALGPDVIREWNERKPATARLAAEYDRGWADCYSEELDLKLRAAGDKLRSENPRPGKETEQEQTMTPCPVRRCDLPHSPWQYGPYFGWSKQDVLADYQHNEQRNQNEWTILNGGDSGLVDRPEKTDRWVEYRGGYAKQSQIDFLNSLSRKDSLMAKEKAFWRVESTSGSFSVNYANEYEARQNAERFAKDCPGIRYRLLRAIGHAEVAKPTIWTDYE